jgi:hypothetical protein
MEDDDTAYFHRRAEIELEHAQRATNPYVVAAHYQLAQAYLERVSARAVDVVEPRSS